MQRSLPELAKKYVTEILGINVITNPNIGQLLELSFKTSPSTDSAGIMKSIVSEHLSPTLANQLQNAMKHYISGLLKDATEPLHQENEKLRNQLELIRSTSCSTQLQVHNDINIDRELCIPFILNNNASIIETEIADKKIPAVIGNGLIINTSLVTELPGPGPDLPSVTLKTPDDVPIQNHLEENTVLGTTIDTHASKISLQTERQINKSITSTLEKVEMLIRIYKDHDRHVTKLIGKDESWYQVNVRPVIQCVNECYKGNVLGFCQQFNSKYNKFFICVTRTCIIIRGCYTGP